MDSVGDPVRRACLSGTSGKCCEGPGTDDRKKARRKWLEARQASLPPRSFPPLQATSFHHLINRPQTLTPNQTLTYFDSALQQRE